MFLGRFRTVIPAIISILRMVSYILHKLKAITASSVSQIHVTWIQIKVQQARHISFYPWLRQLSALLEYVLPGASCYIIYRESMVAQRHIDVLLQ